MGVLATALLLTACGNDEPTASDPTPTAPASPSSRPATPSDTASAPTPSDSSEPARVAAPVYFTGKTPVGTRLYREFRQVEADNPVDEALALLTAGDADDPDYSTLLPEGKLAEISHDEAFLIALPDESWTTRPTGMSAQEARLALQQIVYTVQGVMQKGIPLQFYLDDKPVDIFGIPTPTKTQGYQAAKQLDVLALVNVTQPQQNSQPGDHFTASGVASSFEATVPWEVRDESGKVVLSGSATAEGWTDKLYPWQTDVDASGLPPGQYTFVAKTDDPSDGEGKGPTEDSKLFTLN